MKNKKIKQVKFLLLFSLLLLIAFSYGCAGTRASIHPLQPVEEGLVLTNYNNLDIKTEISNGVKMSQSRADGLVMWIISMLEEKYPNRFAKIGRDCLGISVAVNEPSTMLVTINFTQYEEGSRFLRWLMPGLGQMHIDGIVKILDKETNKVIAEYEVSKTFAWGGAYGELTGIAAIEPAFAEAVVDIILQKD